MFSFRATRIFVALCLSCCFLLLIGCGGGGQSSGGGANPRAITRIAISPQNPILNQGNSLQLTATGVYNDGSQQDLTAQANWKSSQPSVATVNANGNLTAVGTGSAQMSAQYQGVTGNSSVTVEPPVLVSITVNPAQSSLPVGESEQLNATGAYSDGTTQDLTRSATWSSSGSGIAAVDGTGTTVANAVGTATINASSGIITGSALVTVIPAAVVSLNIIPGNLSMALGSSQQLQAIATLSDGSTQDMTGLVSWNSAQPDVASVSNGGLAVAQQVGSTTIAASSGAFTAFASISVTPLIAVNYFDLKNAVNSGADGTLRLTNAGLTQGNLCAMIYVFDENQEMSECCGCTVSDGGLRSLSLVQDLTANPLTGHKVNAGTIKIVPSNVTQESPCDPGSVTPTGVILGWGSNVQAFPDGTFQISETKLELAPLSDGEASALVSECNYLRNLGSGQGVCSCGSGD
jgi:uncharacterized protein YjdB